MTNDPRSQLAAELAALRLRVHELESRKAGRVRPLSAAERVLESSTEGALWADRDGRISFLNRVASELTGWPADDALGADFRRVLAPADNSAQHPIEGVLTNGTTEHHERYTIVDRAGEAIDIAISAAPLIVRGEVAGVVASFSAVGTPLTTPPAELSQAQFEALLEVAAAQEIDSASFRETAEALLEPLVTATGADRIVLLVTERVDGQAGQLMLEAPAGSRPPASKGIPKRRRKPRAQATPQAETAIADGRLPSLEDTGVSSIVALPLKVRERVVGMLSAVSSKPDYFDQNRVRMLSASVDRLVMAFERRQWRQDAEMLSVSSETLYSASRIMSSHGGFDEKAAALLRLATRSANGSAAAFLAADRQGGPLHCVAGGPFESDLSPEAIAHSIVGRAQAHKSVTTTYDVAGDGVAHGLDVDGGRFAVAAPVMVAAEVHGVLLIAGHADVSLSPDLLRLLSALGENLGVLLMSARLGQRVNAALDREFAVLEAVKSAAERLAIVETPADALGHLVEGARDLVGARIGGVAVWRRSGALETVVTSGASGIQQQTPTSGIVPEVLRLVKFALVQERRRSLLVNDSPYVEGSEDMGAGFNSVLGVPFTCTDGRTGSIFMVDKEPSGRFAVEDERLLGLFCAMTSVLLDNIRLFKAEERERRTLDAIHESMAEGLVVLDADGQIMFCNTAAESLLGVGQAEVLGTSLRAWFLRNQDRFDEAEDAKAFAEMLAQGRGATELVMFREARLDVAFTLFPIDVAQGERLTGLLLRDITEEREHERRRDRFVSMASHDIRNPMTTVMGFTELMLSAEYTPERRQTWLKHIYDDAGRALAIVDDMLNISHIQSGDLKFQLEPVSASRVLEETADKFRTPSDNHQILVKTAANLPPIMADRNKFMQVVVNLVSNAVKYSPNGGSVTLSSEYDAEKGRVVVSVKDEGIGISEKDQAKLFNTFQRIERPETENIKGTGLGLYIVKGLVEKMGGEIWLKSAENEGATFFVAMPVLGRGQSARIE